MAASARPVADSRRGTITAFDSTGGRAFLIPLTERAQAGSLAASAAICPEPGPDTIALRRLTDSESGTTLRPLRTLPGRSERKARLAPVYASGSWPSRRSLYGAFQRLPNRR